MQYENLFTKVEIPISSYPIRPTDHPVLLGSCFTDNIGERFLRSGYNVCVNPCGVLYNPVSIANIIDMALEQVREPMLAEMNNRWFSWSMSTKFSAQHKEEASKLIENALEHLHNSIYASNVMIITLGTAWVYMLDETGTVVGNCHKAPAEIFSRKRLSEQKILLRLSDVVKRVREHKPAMRFIFTVSPIRHFKDGAVENTLSKAVLHCALNSLVQKNDGVEYFPAYEIMIDELRDYRFYATDRLHPSEVAVDYIWKRFCDTYVSATDLQSMREAEKIWKRSQHRRIVDS